ncbi:hypothetical protein Gasu2_64860 [Galdieria sulphuraria]|nr:hypothetical protein Gasu2_64860 [Galdieria sulphuraria]
MHEFYRERWGLIVNNDVYFPSGSLKSLKYQTELTLLEDPHLCLGFVSFRNMHFGYSGFVATSRLVQYAGYFDENLFPAYYDDNELDIRLREVNRNDDVCTRHDIVFSNGIHHGIEDQQGYLSGTAIYLDEHENSSFRDAQRRGSRNNPVYVAEKWGCQV